MLGLPLEEPSLTKDNIGFFNNVSENLSIIERSLDLFLIPKQNKLKQIPMHNIMYITPCPKKTVHVVGSC